MATNAGQNVITDMIAAGSPPQEVVEQIAARDSLHIPHNPDAKTAVFGDVASSSSDGDIEHPLPTEEQSATLRKVPGNLSLVAFALCLVEFAERASYYGAQNLFANFIEFPLPKGGNGAGAPPKGTQETAGALNMGLQASSGFVLLFKFLAYVIPIFGGWWADTKVGRYYAIVVGVLICGVAHIIQIIGAIPAVLQQGTAHAAPPFIIGLLILAVGAGIFKPNVAPTVLDQQLHAKEYVMTLKNGEKVIVSPELTTTRTMLIFYGFVNVGAFYMLATSYAEKDIGYWLAFLLAGIIYFLLPILLLVMYKRTKKAPPSGSDLINAVKIIGTALKKSKFQIWKKGFWDSAKPSVLAQQGIIVGWSDKLVDDVRRTIDACHIFFFFPIYNLNDGGIGSVPSNQGAAMITNGAPNDLLNNFNPLTIIAFVPFLSYVIYPILNRLGIRLGPIDRITIGFFLAGLSSVAGAIVQHYVYKLSPCGYYASTCDEVAPISIWWQIPNNVLSAASECFANVTAYELAYSRAPPAMRSLVVAVFLFMTALSSALGEILIPVQVDPYLVWLWAAPAVALAVQTIWLNIHFRHLNSEEFMTSEVIVESPVSRETQQTKV
ncbi:MFS peptide transporter, putative [Talaromyces stipitatus ATCC 10500]|uniref:MFS peptide transporter, putative n=1 Tax=Talaromyces stipitatus (strain ATCC 10500 / CBS 375.48 / QM 6759 / NRRL 1006) TaxID=441959 RepID=B8MQ62_TALSN|nr:MFS peptide transporter, putative [Talaromyces stipitatus ATCC 10500]EED13088.1 MFS peptide transporter, putative [Talaromyces stipitatus ATCC 10500]